jgi:hypothetical protein
METIAAIINVSFLHGFQNFTGDELHLHTRYFCIEEAGGLLFAWSVALSFLITFAYLQDKRNGGKHTSQKHGYCENTHGKTQVRRCVASEKHKMLEAEPANISKNRRAQ